ncbi:hypothetical protein COCCU_06960 [Corynebacterium occultum]|uniref:Methyltransferase domain-containing protein n=1 Tax=Corynebacterium occultum TaxID=2675219 RepID=A0A6B8W8T7_9CORY|nr:class I SAM-dependent methyltransferase [Corynebacterium occultum]QGU07326.1 hypothetical protein COCCU_06960 [Corynebacterium occultum]
MVHASKGEKSGLMENHGENNSTYHRWVISVAKQKPQARVLEVGCGEGFLVQQLASAVAEISGLEPNPDTFSSARDRVIDLPNAHVLPLAFADLQPDPGAFDLIIFMDSIHHMNLAPALAKARIMLRPGGDLLIVGVSANLTFRDRIISGLQFLLPRIGPPPTEAAESLQQIRDIAREIMPGVWVRRVRHHRYLLRWTKPAP